MHQYVASELTDSAEEAIVRKFILTVVKDRVTVLYVWGSYEERFVTMLRAKYPHLPWRAMDGIEIIDVCSWIQRENIAFPGATTFSLKAIGKALYERDMISRTWNSDDNDVQNGLDAMLSGNTYYENKTPSALRDLKRYNEEDVMVMKEICELFT